MNSITYIKTNQNDLLYPNVQLPPLRSNPCSRLLQSIKIQNSNFKIESPKC